MNVIKEGFRVIFEVRKVESISLKNAYTSDKGRTTPPRVIFRTSMLSQEEGELGLTDVETNLDVTVNCDTVDGVKLFAEFLRKLEHTKETFSFPAFLPRKDQSFKQNYDVVSLINGEELLKLNEVSSKPVSTKSAS